MIVGVLITVEAAILPPVWEVEDESYHFVLWLEMKSRLGLSHCQYLQTQNGAKGIL